MPDNASFSKDLRLRKHASFQTVFKKRRRCHGTYYTLCSCSNQRSLPRLGLVASKRNLRLAVQRNRAKRVAREVFRHYQSKLVGLDLVFVVRQAAKDASKEELRRCLEKLLKPFMLASRSS